MRSNGSIAALTAAIAAALAVIPASTQARPALVAATPAANGTVAKPVSIVLTFSEDLEAPLSGIDLVMTAMPGMAHHEPMPIKGIAPRAEGRKLVVALPRPLPTGTYLLTWHAAGADREDVRGSYTFTVR
jgi:methionine-rich copper-binding protein CopC